MMTRHRKYALHLMSEKACFLNRQHPGIFISFIDMAVPPAWGGGEGTPCDPWCLHRVDQVSILVNALGHGCVYTCMHAE